MGTIVVDLGNFLLVQWIVELSFGKWSFLGGAVELGEGVRDVVVRETIEETCLELELIQDTSMAAYDIF